MQANTIITDEMTLDEKLAAIDAAMANAMASAVANAKSQQNDASAAPVDPADLTMCLGCQ